MKDIFELFSKMDIEDNEKDTFLNYIRLKGRFLHKQVYDTILLTDKSAKYSEISRIIRYDKHIRDVLYKYLSALEEQWRAIAFDNFDYESDKNEVIKKEIDLSKVSVKKQFADSTFYWSSYNKSFTLNKLIDVFKANRYTLDLNITDEMYQTIKTLRNSVMHHNLIMFSYKTTVEDVNHEIESLESKISLLWKLLDDNMKEAFEKAINMGNYKGGDFENQLPNLNRYCLRRFSHGVFI
ncbi:MAG: hypothetical protein C4543_01810 [Ignavibacteriales bacterium]|jgi:hypothetical protein|nr:MAG: hypothetical protein C4543_01810 [Ignavibacteriales bacterium]